MGRETTFKYNDEQDGKACRWPQGSDQQLRGGQMHQPCDELHILQWLCPQAARTVRYVRRFAFRPVCGGRLQALATSFVCSNTCICAKASNYFMPRQPQGVVCALTW